MGSHSFSGQDAFNRTGAMWDCLCCHGKLANGGRHCCNPPPFAPIVHFTESRSAASSPDEESIVMQDAKLLSWRVPRPSGEVGGDILSTTGSLQVAKPAESEGFPRGHPNDTLGAFKDSSAYRVALNQDSLRRQNEFKLCCMRLKSDPFRVAYDTVPVPIRAQLSLSLGAVHFRDGRST